MARADDLIALSAQQALQGIQADIQSAQSAYQSALQSGDTQNAAWQMRTIAALVEEGNRVYTALGGGQQQPQQQQAQGGLTPAQAQWLQRNPQYQNDPRKFAEIFLSHHQLVGHGLDPNSPEYIAAIDMAAGNPIPDPEKPLTADEVCEIVGIDADTYNKNAADLLTLKSLGHYKDGR